MALYYANVAQMDDALGRVLAALRELDLEQDTIVVYTADHGELLGDHGLWHKFQFYEGSCGVPLLIRVPQTTIPGSICSTPVSQVEVLPTLAELCGVKLPALDGKSLVPQLRHPLQARRQPVYSEFNLQTPRAKYMIRSGDFKYTLRVNDIGELYDLKQDPDEMDNLALKAAFKSRAEDLKDQLFQWYRPPELKAG
jgi:choline-sulfatase